MLLSPFRELGRSISRRGHAVGAFLLHHPMVESTAQWERSIFICCCPFLFVFFLCFPSPFFLLLLFSPPLHKAINPTYAPGPTWSHLTVLTSLGAPFPTPPAYTGLEGFCFLTCELWGNSFTTQALTCQSTPAPSWPDLWMIQGNNSQGCSTRWTKSLWSTLWLNTDSEQFNGQENTQICDKLVFKELLKKQHRPENFIHTLHNTPP